MIYNGLDKKDFKIICYLFSKYFSTFLFRNNSISFYLHYPFCICFLQVVHSRKREDRRIRTPPPRFTRAPPQAGQPGAPGALGGQPGGGFGQPFGGAQGGAGGRANVIRAWDWQVPWKPSSWLVMFMSFEYFKRNKTRMFSLEVQTWEKENKILFLSCTSRYKL